MAITDRLQHHKIPSMALPYAPFRNVSDTAPHYVAGSNVIIGLDGVLSRRPGFAAHTADDYSTDTIKRFLTWQEWDGTFHVIINVVTATDSVVYKQTIGTDVTFQSLYTDSGNTEPFDFAIANNKLFFMNGNDRIKWDGVSTASETNWGTTAPATAPSLADGGAGSVPAAIGHQYVFAYGNSSTGYLSDISPASAVWSTADRDVDLTGASSTDSQIDKVHVYRTLDGGSIYYELSNSPIANGGTWAITDSDTDIQLTTTQAPIATINGRPGGGLGPVAHAGRIWYFKDDGVYFSGFEEVNNGVVEESFPTDNVFRFGQEVTALAPVGGVLLVFTRSGIYRITGDSLATFRRDILTNTGGVHNRAAVARTGDLVGWFDVANIVRVTDGVDTIEISKDIRSDIDSVIHADIQCAFYDDGKKHWFVMMDAGNEDIRIYDFDLGFWFPQWDISNVESVGTGQTAEGTHKLFIGRAGKPLAMNTAVFTDEGSNFTANITTALMDLTDPDNPAQRGELAHVILETNSTSPTTIERIMDEDPKSGSFTDLAANVIDPPGRVDPSAYTLVEQWYNDQAALARRVAIKLTWAAAATEFQVHNLSVGYRIKS